MRSRRPLTDGRFGHPSLPALEGMSGWPFINFVRYFSLSANGGILRTTVRKLSAIAQLRTAITERFWMLEHRIIIYGNAGSGKTTMARQAAAEFDIPHLCLDDIAWGETAVRKPLSDSLADLREFVSKHASWVIEGCYGDLLEAALPLCTELRFLNPGIEACIERCRNRPWEPTYCASPEEQQRFLGPLIEFVREYETRTDEYSLARHRALFDQFTGPKCEYRE